MSGKNALQRSPDQGPNFTLEEQYKGPVCGIDEVGRGPLAGPVLAACVYIPKSLYKRRFIKEINDSKKLSLKKREAIFLQIREHCPYGIGMASHEEIDTLNIHNATLLAMRRAYNTLLDDFKLKPDMALIDGKFIPNISCNAQAITKGDSQSLSIAAASIMAKVTRDRIMLRLHNEHPHYGWKSNAGYGTAEHIEAIKRHGVTNHHRRSFRPVREAIETDPQNRVIS